MQADKIRATSWDQVEKHGWPINVNLPLMEEVGIVRDKDEIIKRLLCMHSLAAVSYGFDREKAIAWLNQERLFNFLLDPEIRYLKDRIGDNVAYQIQIEGMWALSWSLNINSDIDPMKSCSDTFYEMFPNLPINEDSAKFLPNAKLKNKYEIISYLDYYYCLHWSLRHLILSNQTNLITIKPYIITERRRALEWLTHADDWYDISLDT